MINAAALDKPACPLPTDGDGVFPNASNALALVVVEDGKARVSGPLAPRVDPAFPLLDAVAASTKFWSVPVLQSWLCRSLGQTSSVLFTDGGVVDTTGIVAHLQKRTPRILAFYHDNNQLDEELSSSTLSSPLAYLFGRAVAAEPAGGRVRQRARHAAAEAHAEALWDGTRPVDLWYGRRSVATEG